MTGALSIDRKPREYEYNYSFIHSQRMDCLIHCEAQPNAALERWHSLALEHVPRQSFEGISQRATWAINGHLGEKES